MVIFSAFVTTLLQEIKYPSVIACFYRYSKNESFSVKEKRLAAAEGKASK